MCPYMKCMMCYYEMKMKLSDLMTNVKKECQSKVLYNEAYECGVLNLMESSKSTSSK